MARDLDREQDVLVEVATRLGEIHLEQGAVVRSACGDHHVVDRTAELGEEPLEESRIADVERGDAGRAHLRRGGIETIPVPTRQQDVGALGSARRAVARPMPELPPMTTTS